jgi:ABC-2 type transport system ATP-binding protein
MRAAGELRGTTSQTDAQQRQDVSDTSGDDAVPRPAPILNVEDARFAYGDRQVLAGASLNVYPGEILVLLGRNGAGKSTLVKAVTGRIALAGGQLSVSGADPRRNPATRAEIGLVPQQLAIYDKLTPLENLCIFGRLMGVATDRLGDAADGLLAQIGLSARANEPLRALSGGMKRRVNVGAALMHGPKLLILDEPTVGIDTKAREDICDMLRQLRDDGLAIMLTTHDMAEAETLADRVAIMVDGQVKAIGTPAELVRHYFGGRMEVSVTAARPLGAALDDKECDALKAAGFKICPRSNTIHGLIEMTGEDIPGIFQTLVSDTPEAQEIRVRRPGLDTLLSYFADREPDEREPTQ